MSAPSPVTHSHLNQILGFLRAHGLTGTVHTSPCSTGVQVYQKTMDDYHRAETVLTAAGYIVEEPFTSNDVEGANMHITAKLAAPVDLNEHEARAITEQIKSAIGDLMTLVARAWQGRVWIALGYESWADYIQAEFGHAPISLPREERAAVVELLRGQGMSTRAIAPAVGVDQKTVVNDLAGEENSSPEPVTGLDGKTYKPRQPGAKPARRSPMNVYDIEDKINGAETALTRAAKLLNERHGDNRYSGKKRLELDARIARALARLMNAAEYVARPLDPATLTSVFEARVEAEVQNRLELADKQTDTDKSTDDERRRFSGSQVHKKRKPDVAYLSAGMRVVDQNLRKAIEVAESIDNFDTNPMTDHLVKLIDGVRMKLDVIERLAKGTLTDDEMRQILDGPS